MRVLFIGEQPEAVDYSNPSLPPGTTAAKIHAGLTFAMTQMKERGWRADLCLIQPDGTAAEAVAQQLKKDVYDCVVIGGGIRIPPPSLELFETIINAVHKGAPQARIAFNSRPEDTADAAARVSGIR
jgi:hypothetical protein